MPADVCKVCVKPILIAIFKGTDYCSENCKKEANDEPLIKVRDGK